MFEVIRGIDGMPVVATRHEVWRAWFLTNGIARAICGMGPDTGAPLPGVDPHVERYVRRLRRLSSAAR
jgi:hypothetical protein